VEKPNGWELFFAALLFVAAISIALMLSVSISVFLAFILLNGLSMAGFAVPTGFSAYLGTGAALWVIGFAVSPKITVQKS
jgi:hypothetical protein